MNEKLQFKKELFVGENPVPNIYIGIDPGDKTGVAVYSKHSGLNLMTLSFWKTIDYFNRVVIPNEKTNTAKHHIIIESTQRNNFMFSKRTNGKGVAESMRIARNVGMNQGDAKRLIEFMNIHGLSCEEFTPGPRDKKWNVEFFYQLSGIETAISHEHIRDASRFIARYWVDEIKQ